MIEDKLEIDTSLKVDFFCRPKIVITVINKGKRSCFKYNFQAAIFSEDWVLFSYHLGNESVNPLNTGGVINFQHITSIDKTSGFYYFVNITYEDVFTKNTYNQHYFYHYKKIRNEHCFYECDKNEKDKIVELLVVK